jgi:hypothetical protein
LFDSATAALPVSTAKPKGGATTAKKIIQIILSIGQSMSYPLFQDGAMKRYKTKSLRRSLLPVPYSVRPDRIERGLRILRALRFSIAAAAAPIPRPHQREFDFPPVAKIAR